MGYTNQRVTYGSTLVEPRKQNERTVVLDTDLGASTMGKLLGTEFPGRHFEMGITETDVTSAAAGLAQIGKISFTNSFAMFAGGRTYSQIRQITATGKLNVKICGSFSGSSDFEDDATHRCVESLAIFRTVPNITVVCPADANETVEAVKVITAVDGPCYLRLNKNDYFNVTKEGEKFTLGVPGVLKGGTGTALSATGYMIGLALEATVELERSVSVKVIDISTIKPMDAEAVRKMVEDCQVVITAEEHSVIGGSGSALVEVFCGNPKPMKMVRIKDTFGCSGHNYQEVLKFHGLIKAVIMKAIMEMAEL